MQFIDLSSEPFARERKRILPFWNWKKGTFAFLDSGHGRLTSDQNLHCILTIRRGEVVWDTHGLSTEDWKQAGPYSNFK